MSVNLMLPFILIMLFHLYLQFPVAFTVIRKAQPSLNYQQYLSSICRPTFNSISNMQVGYNLVSLAGFTQTTTYSSLDNTLTPLTVWKRLYEIVLGNKPSPFANSNTQLQSHVLNNVFHANGSKLLMHVDLLKFPISGSLSLSATTLGQQILNTLTQLKLDGVSIHFQDSNAVADGRASDWLWQLLTTIVQTPQSPPHIVLIIPAQYVPVLPLFKSPHINSVISNFVLKYYHNSKPDYTSYQSIFQASIYYIKTSLFQLQRREDLFLDVCRTLIAKPTNLQSAWNTGQYLSMDDLASSFTQAYTTQGWFGGLANLDYNSDSNKVFVDGVLSSMREQCRRTESCIC